MSSFLPDSDSDSEDLHDLVVNKAYADKFEEKERQRELERARYLGLDEEDDDEDDDEEEDDDAELLSAKINLQVINTINSLRKKDPKIYDPASKWFDEEEEGDDVLAANGDDEEGVNIKKTASIKLKSSSKKRYKDVLREQILEDAEDDDDDDGDDDDDDDEEDDEEDDEKIQPHKQSAAIKSTRFNYDKEQESIRRQFLDSIKSSGVDEDDEGDHEGDDDDDDDDILVVKERDPREVEKEKKELQKALREMSSLASKEKKEELEKDAFLTNYISSEKWKDKQLKFSTRGLTDEEVDEEERELDKVDRFESKYNFRFEELQEEQEEGHDDEDDEDAAWKRHLPASTGAHQVQGHSRSVEGSVRRVDDSRKLQRESRAERKARELRQKQAELMRLKNLKKQELMSRLKKIQEVGGLGQLAEGLDIDPNVLDDEWDPEEHERMMQRQFGDAYYEGEEDATWLSRAQEDEELRGLLLEDDPDLAVDEEDDLADVGPDDEVDEGDYEEPQEDEEDDGSTHRSSKGKKVVADMLDELYQLDYEDIVAGIPCRFKYRKVEAEDYGLSADDILEAEDAELNQYVSLKKLAPYRSSKADTPVSKLAKRRKRLRAAIRERMEQAQAAEKKKPPSAQPQDAAANSDDEDNTKSVHKREKETTQDGKKKRIRKHRKTPEGENVPAPVISKAYLEAHPTAADRLQPTFLKSTKKSAADSSDSQTEKKTHKSKRKSKDVAENPLAKRLALYK